MKNVQWIKALQTMFHKEYWTLPNTVEFFAFFIKALIIIPGLIFGMSVWWLYIFALISSLSLVWSSTIKTLPTIIWFNLLWSALSVIYLLKYFFGV